MNSEILKSENWAIQKALGLLTPEDVSLLMQKHKMSQELDHQFKDVALRLIDKIYSFNSNSQTRKQLTELLLGLGYRKDNVSRMLDARDLVKRLKDNKSDATDWVTSLPINTAYELSKMEPLTLARAWEMSSFGENKVTIKELRALRDKHDRPKVATSQQLEENPEKIKLEKGLKTFSDYPDVVEAIQQALTGLD